MAGHPSMAEHEARTERQWVARSQAGDRDAFDRLVERHFPRIYSIEFRLVGNHEDAEDLAQECFVRAWGALGLFRDRGSFSGWLVRIAVHLAQDHHRRRGVRGEAVPLGELVDPESPAVGPAQATGRRELQRTLEGAIDALPTNLRVALVLRVLEGLSYDEIGEATGLRPGTVRTQVMKARRWLSRTMGRHLDGGAS